VQSKHQVTMRHRSKKLESLRSAIGNYSYKANVPGHWSFDSLTSGVGSIDRFKQFMTDELQSGIWHFNNCSNVKSQLTEFASVLLTEGNNISVGSKAFGLSARTLIEPSWSVLRHETAPSFEGLTGHLDRYDPLFSDPRLKKDFQIRSDPFDTDFSAWYLLVDLLDFKKLIRGLLKGAMKTRPIIGSNPHALADSPYTARDFHNNNLLIKFGVIPTINDIRQLLRTISQWSKKYGDVGALAAKRYKAHVNVEKLDELVNFAELDPWEEEVSLPIPGSSIGSPYTLRVSRTVEASWHAEALYGFTCPEFQGWVSRLGQITDSFGLLDPAALWDVIPFSFVVDWFYSVSTWLHKNRPRLFPATAVLHDYLETIKVKSTVKYYLKDCYNVSFDSPYYQPINNLLLGEESTTTYIRRRFRPPDGYVVMVPRERGPASFIQVLRRVGISASLVGQRLPR
jgi:hypothetical protein